MRLRTMFKETAQHIAQRERLTCFDVGRVGLARLGISCVDAAAAVAVGTYAAKHT